MSPHEREIAELIIKELQLEDMTPEDIDVNAPLFGEGLGLDSIDALELGLAVSKRYGFQLRSNEQENTQIFGSLGSLSRYIEAHRAAQA